MLNKHFDVIRVEKLWGFEYKLNTIIFVLFLFQTYVFRFYINICVLFLTIVPSGGSRILQKGFYFFVLQIQKCLNEFAFLL